MSVLTAVILGLVQGIAEFLPISSSGHLAIAEHLLNMQGASNVPDFFDVLLHLGTLVAVFAAYWDDIRDMIVEFFTGIGDLAHHRTPNPVPPARRLILLIIVGTLPLFVMVPFRHFFTGLIGMLSSASLNETKFGLYEPSHGSAPDIAGQNKANPIATILSAAMLLRYSLNLDEEADAVEAAVQKVLTDGYRTGDIMSEGCKKVGTKEMGDLIAAAV